MKLKRVSNVNKTTAHLLEIHLWRWQHTKNVKWDKKAHDGNSLTRHNIKVTRVEKKSYLGKKTHYTHAANNKIKIKFKQKIKLEEITIITHIALKQ